MSATYDKIFRHFQNSVLFPILSAGKPVELLDDFVKYFYNNGGMQIEEFINRYYKKHRTGLVN